MITVYHIILLLYYIYIKNTIVVCLFVCVFVRCVCVCVCPELIEKTILPREQKFRE